MGLKELRYEWRRSPFVEVINAVTHGVVAAHLVRVAETMRVRLRERIAPRNTQLRRGSAGPQGVTSAAHTRRVRLGGPRDRDGTFEPQMVPKHEQHFHGFDDKLLTMYARGMSVCDMRAHLEKIYGVSVDADLEGTPSRLCDSCPACCTARYCRSRILGACENSACAREASPYSVGANSPRAKAEVVSGASDVEVFATPMADKTTHFGHAGESFAMSELLLPLCAHGPAVFYAPSLASFTVRFALARS